MQWSSEQVRPVFGKSSSGNEKMWIIGRGVGGSVPQGVEILQFGLHELT